ncbi:MAG TPA: Calx-beta domain-containing protein [Sedimentisphaerales bacterium]|nr:Calx-beta domain-containing protein [Sedimentisphaerales bacterium]
MYRNSALLVCVVVVFCFAGGSALGQAIMQCDTGGCGPLQSGWTGLSGCGTHINVAGSGIDVTLATGNPGACECRNPGGTGTLADVEADLLFANDEQSSPGGDFIITLSNLTSGMTYRLLSYHNRSDEGDTTIPGVTITGGTPISVPASIVQTHAIMDDPAECVFTAGAGDVSIRYLAPVGGCAGCQAFLNGFVLEYVGPTISFATDTSGGIESISPALVEVKLTNPVGGATYTVQYAATGGTATPGVDYNLTPDTLVFNPGDTSKFISIEIISDQELEEDETIILELSNATGPDVMLGISQHTYVISDLAPKVLFDSAASSGLESHSPAMIKVKLSHASDDTVTVNYGVTGGTATSGADYSVVGNMLTFVPGDVTEYISINIVDDTITESQETIDLALSGPVNATIGTPAQHTYSILDNEQGVYFDGLIWYYSSTSNPLYVTPENQLVWAPEGEEQIITRLPEQSLSVGNKVEMTYWWMTDGDHDCPDCFACPDGCYDDSIECIAGTSDLRAGLFEADGEYITGDGYSVTGSSVFAGYKGYAWRFGPNMLAGPTRWVDCTGEVHKTGNFQKKSASLDNLMYTNDGLEAYIPGFELTPGEWSLWTISLEHTDDGIVSSITLNDTTYTWTDTSSTDRPSKIDVFAFHMRNHRPYSIWTIEPVAPPPPPCKNLAGDPIIDWDDLGALADWWIHRCREGEWCEGRDINEDGAVTMFDFVCLAYWWQQPCPPE